MKNKIDIEVNPDFTSKEKITFMETAFHHMVAASSGHGGWKK